MCSYQQLPLWQQARSLAEQVYRMTDGLPTADYFDLAARMRLTSVAIPVEIATHYSPDGSTFLRGLKRARDALVLFEHLADLATRVNYWPPTRARSIARQTIRIRQHMQAFFHSLAP